MKITADDLKRLGIVEWVIPEEEPAGEENLPEIAAMMRKRMDSFLETSSKTAGDRTAETKI